MITGDGPELKLLNTPQVLLFDFLPARHKKANGRGQ